jgi:hypothetical protein
MSRIAAVLLLGAAACGGGSSTASATFSGVVRGQPMKPADAISSPARVSLGAVSADVAAIVLSDAAGVCGKVNANTEPKNGKALIILLADFDPAAFSVTAPAGPATFNVINPNLPGITPSHLAVVTFGVNDSSCTEVPAQSAVATSGSVKVTSVANGAYSGTYTIGFETGEQVSGEFHTANCPGLANYLANTTHSCGG